jgi:hypothetical protein
MRVHAVQTQDCLAAVSSQARGLRSAACQFAAQHAARNQQLHIRVAHACSVAVQRRAGVRCCVCHLVCISARQGLLVKVVRCTDGSVLLYAWHISEVTAVSGLCTSRHASQLWRLRHVDRMLHSCSPVTAVVASTVFVAACMMRCCLSFVLHLWCACSCCL